MRRRIPMTFVILLALSLVLVLTTASWADPPANSPGAVNDGKDGYLGSNVCKGCHSDKHTTLQETLHPWKVRPKEEATIVGNWPVEWDGKTYTTDDFDWVIGAHPKWKQRYIKIQEDGKWAILPFQWNIETQEFVAYNHAGDYRDDCAGCHTTGYDVASKTWKEPGVWCEACHGPGSDHIANIGNPPGQRGIYAKPDPEVCGSCHTRGKTKDGMYNWPEGYIPGGDVHLDDIWNVTTDPGKWWFDNPEDENDPYHAKSHHQQYPEWEASKHSSALENIRDLPFTQDSCLECHSDDYRSDPENVTKETAEFGITCQTCHINHEPGEIGSQLVKEPYELCTECHNGDLPESGKFEPGKNVHHPMQEVFEGIGFPGIEDIPSPHFQSDAGATCNSCHMAKTAKSAVTGDITSHRFAVAMPGDVKDGEPDSCTGCHTDSSKENLQNIIDSRHDEIVDKLAMLNETAMDNGCPDLSTGPAGDSDACKLAYTGYTMVNAEGSFGMHNYYYDRAILQASTEAFGEPAYDLPYVGSITCSACHSEKYNDNLKTLHPWKVRPKEEAIIVGQFPMEWDGVTYTEDSFDWVIGAHPKWKQRYIDIQDDGKWAILPFQWNMETQEFAPYSHSGDYREDCSGCHTTGLDVDLFGVTEIPWNEPGITCESCHGPGQDHVLSADKENDPMIYKSLDSEVCGSCHTRGKTKDGMYNWPEGYVPGGDVHLDDIWDVTTSPSKWWFDNPDDPDDPGHAKSHHQQYPEWERSKHSMALDTIQSNSHAQNFCLGCHSEDYRRDSGNVTVESAQNTIECVTCHATHDPGAEGTSQLLMSQYDTCVQCHNGGLEEGGKFTPGSSLHHPMQEMFEGIGMPDVIDNPSAHFLASDEGGGPVCSSCHFARTAKSATWTNWDNGLIKKGDIASHLLIPVMPGNAAEAQPDACSTCHSWPKSVGQSIIDSRQSQTQASLDELDGWLDRLQAMDNEDVAYAHTAFSFVDSDGSTGFHNFDYASEILKEGIDRVDDYQIMYLPAYLHP